MNIAYLGFLLGAVILFLIIPYGMKNSSFQWEDSRATKKPDILPYGGKTGVRLKAV